MRLDAEDAPHLQEFRDRHHLKEFQEFGGLGRDRGED